MHHFPLHIGDYQKKTKGFSLAEHGAYLQLMAEYYTTEKPLSLDKERLYRICGAVTKLEKAAVDSVLESKFTITDSGYVNPRCDEEIEKYKSRADIARSNGQKGGRPTKQENPVGNQVGNPAGIPEHNPNKTRGKPTEKANPGTQNSESRNQSGPDRTGSGFDWRKLPEIAHLKSTSIVMEWFDIEAVKAGITEASDENRIWVLAACERALSEKNIDNRPNLFVVLIDEFVSRECKPDWKLKNYRARAEARFKKWKGSP